MNNNLFSINEGFSNGNLFINLYDQYLNYQLPLISNNEKDSNLAKIQALSFAVLELNLYLDTNPNDDEKIKAFNNCNDELKKLINNYEMKYGALSISSANLKNYPWSWINEPWPWEGDF